MVTGPKHKTHLFAALLVVALSVAASGCGGGGGGGGESTSTSSSSTRAKVEDQLEQRLKGGTFNSSTSAEIVTAKSVQWAPSATKEGDGIAWVTASDYQPQFGSVTTVVTRYRVAYDPDSGDIRSVLPIGRLENFPQNAHVCPGGVMVVGRPCPK